MTWWSSATRGYGRGQSSAILASASCELIESSTLPQEMQTVLSIATDAFFPLPSGSLFMP